ncbi:MAG: pseudouridine synthase [Planctomycetota bacterium]
MELPVLYQDEHIVAVNKPAGMLVHRSKIEKRVFVFALQTLRNQLGRHVYPVHRLDRPTSGILLFSLSLQAAADLCEQFEKRTVRKIYEAVVRGHIMEGGTRDEPLREKHDRKSDKRARHCKESQQAITGFEPLKHWTIPLSAGKYEHSRYSLVRIEPKTGRKHQIRRHFNHMSHPVIGDSTYGDRRHNRLFREQLGIVRLLLHARHLHITHPVTGNALSIEAGYGTEFEAAVQKLNEHDVE